MRLIVGTINLVIFLGTQRAPIQKLKSRMLDIANALPRMKLSGHNSDEEGQLINAIGDERFYTCC